jgi:transcriptional regulator with XRE-family HTH domain
MKPRKLIKRRREELGLTQDEVAADIGMTRSGYANLENGYRPISDAWIKPIARALRLRPSSLER